MTYVNIDSQKRCPMLAVARGSHGIGGTVAHGEQSAAESSLEL
jgi:hypothetical protein